MASGYSYILPGPNLTDKWGGKYAIAVKSWENNWAELSNYPPDIRRLIYTTNSVEGYHRQLRKVIKTKGAFPSAESVRKLFYLVNCDITSDWTMPIPNWACILNQLSICFKQRVTI
ncbi:MAG: transposase [Chloroflexi bacterium]|uniref:Mutator family transposase n=1 Tax=Candidatus Chlorohelix allophototropha TaxID=3003348 RepID=A0A8T7M6F9_9CHLR|nr:transposase [Chloroflexota bacterium]